MNNFWQKKKVCVTGANGFIGRAVVSQLVRAGAYVTAAVSPRFSGAIDGATIVPRDLLNLDNALDVCQGQEAIFHCAALDGGAQFKKAHEAEMLSVNTTIGTNILTAAGQTEVERLLLISSIDVYGALGKPLITEEDALPPDDLPGYGQSKRVLELAAEEAVRSKGAKIAIARLGNMFGPGDAVGKGRVIPTVINTMLQHKPVTVVNPTKELSFLYVDDGARSLLDLLEMHAVGEPVNLVSNQYSTLEALVAQIASIVGDDPSMTTVQSGESVTNRKFSTKKAEQAIGFHEEISLEVGLARTIAWYRDRVS